MNEKNKENGAHDGVGSADGQSMNGDAGVNADENWQERFDQGKGAETSGNAEKKALNGECGGKPCMPKPTFSTFVLSMASSTLVHLGEVPDPATGQHQEDLALAKHGIDILCMLQEKIANGLDAEEARLLEGLLYELRMKFVVKK